MALQKAVIEIDPRDRGRNLPDRLVVQFNPAELTLTKGAQIAEIALPGLDSPVLQFIRGQNETVTLELFFDTTENGMGETGVVDVRELTRPFYQLVKMQAETHAPPRIRFVWGQGLMFKAIVESVQQKFTVFNPAGIPLRALVSLALREYKTVEEQINEINPQTADHRQMRTVRGGETLTQIAFEAYGNASEWRRIAEEPANAGLLDNPRRLQPGIEIVIPPIGVFEGSKVRRP